VDRAIDVAFRREMHDGPGLILVEQPRNPLPVADVAFDEDVPRVVFQTCQIAEVAGIGELVEIHHRRGFGRDPVEHEIGADEARPTRNKYQSGFPKRKMSYSMRKRGLRVG